MPARPAPMIVITLFACILIAMVMADSDARNHDDLRNTTEQPRDPFIVILGIAQDAGYPQAACGKDCCAAAWADHALRRHAACLAIVDPATGERWMIDATPDFPEQLRMLDEIAPPRGALADAPPPRLSGILLTHAHIGHYTGLVHLGREVIGGRNVPVHVMQRMRTFLQTNGPWNQLVELGNIELRDLEDETPIALNDRITITPILVPHRDEYSETVCFRIEGHNRSVLYIPDIDKWTKWDRSIENEIARVDIAYLDGTFFANGEIPGRDMSQIPHPFIEESLARFSALSEDERSKIHFLHLNHTNPALDSSSEARRTVEAAGMFIAEEGEREGL